MWYKIIGTAVGVVAAPFVLPALGFTAGGIAAAGLQSAIGNVAADSAFAIAQNLGATATSGYVSSAVGGVVGAVVGAAIDE